MSDLPEAPPPAPSPTESFLTKLLPLAPIILLSAAGLGLISAFLPGITITIPGLGSASAAVYQGWQGKFGLLGYIAVGIMVGLTMAKTLPLTKGLLLAILITSGVVLLLALLLLLEVLGHGVGFGSITNLFAGLGLAAGAALLAKQEKLF